MEAIVSAVLSDLVSRSVSLIVDKYYKRPKGLEETLQHLRRVLLRVEATVEEAEGRHINNQAMLQQLQMLRKVMYQGCYLLDTFRYRKLQQEQANDEVSSHPFALVKFSRAKLLCTSAIRTNIYGDGTKEIQKMLGSLNSIIDDMAEFNFFLKSYLPISREPYSKYLFLEKCMFGRHAEMEKIISFLLQPQLPGDESLQVLPIIGPPRVGKSTLVEHVSSDKRVLNHFSSIILYSEDPNAPEGRVVKKQIHSSHGRSLVIMDLACDLILEESRCKKLYSSGSHIPPGSKIIITSRSESIIKLGTIGAIRLEFLPQEAYWYFFKVMAFGSTNPEVHPELISIAMEIAAELGGSFLGANIISGLLKENHNAQSWRKILKLQRKQVQRHRLLFGEHPHTLLQKNQTIYLWNMSNFSMYVKVRYGEKVYHQSEVPKIALHDVLTGSAEDHIKFDAVVWKSCIPPYHSYLMRCEIEAPQHMMATKKRPRSIM